MPKIYTPPRKQLPGIRVEQSLHDALVALANEEGRTLSDIVRDLLRSPAPSPGPRLPPLRVEAPLVKDLYDRANREGRTVSDVMRSRLRDQVQRRRESA